MNESALLHEIANDPILIEIARRAVEDGLLSRRDARISILNRGNGLCVREKSGEPSPLIRLTVEDAIAIALKAIASHL